MSATSARSIGEHLRAWRQRRRMSQLALASEAEISTRHLSFIETGRALPSRDMVLHLAERMDVPLRERNVLLIAAGYAPVFAQRDLDDPALASARRAVDLVLRGHEPFPALAVDRHWSLVSANTIVPLLLAGIDPALMKPPVNVLRLTLHPGGLAPRIRNFAEWRAHLLDRLRRQIDVSADPVLVSLMAELRGYPAPGRTSRPAGEQDYAGMVVPLELVTDQGELALFSTTTVFGTPVDVTLSELAVESFFPADARTGELLWRMAGTDPVSPARQAPSGRRG